MAQARTLQFTTDPQEFAQQVRTHFDTPIATCVVTAGVEAANVRRITVQVVDRLKRPWPARWLVWVFLTATAAGDPSGTGNTVAFISGAVQMTALIGGLWFVQADADGQIVFDVTIAGAASRFVGTQPDGGIPSVSAELVWA
jgi:hypothetical protein